MIDLLKHPKLRLVLVISAKHAVNAILTNAGLSALLPQVFNFHDMSHALAFLKATAACVLSREAMVWAPKILKWSTTDVNDDTHNDGGDAGAAAAGGGQ